MQIPTFVIGPGDPEGRNFRFLAESVNLALLPPRQQVTAFDLPLALAAWASQGERECVACIPLSDEPGPVVVLRAEMFGHTGIGRLVYANAVLVDEIVLAALGGAPEKLLPLIPRPDQGKEFGMALLNVDQTTLPDFPAGDWANPDLGLGLAWQPRFIGVADVSIREPVLCAALASIDPSSQRQAVRGWTTSGCWLDRNSFDPAHLFWLVVGDPEDHVRQSRLTWQLTPDASAQPKALTPPSYIVWQSLHTALEPWRKLTVNEAWADWIPAFQPLSPRQVVALILSQATATFGQREMVAMLAKLALSTDQLFVTQALACFWQMVEADEPPADKVLLDMLVSHHPVAMAAMARHASDDRHAYLLAGLALLIKWRGKVAASAPFAQMIQFLLASGKVLPVPASQNEVRDVLSAIASACPHQLISLTRQLPPLVTAAGGSMASDDETLSTFLALTLTEQMEIS